MIMELGVSAKSIGSVCMLSGIGTVTADIIPLPEGWSNWPATAILGFITLATLGVLVMKLRQDYKTQECAMKAQADLAVAISKSHELQERTNQTLSGVANAMMNRPCLLKEDHEGRGQ